jgi:hypothetical protein
MKPKHADREIKTSSFTLTKEELDILNKYSEKTGINKTFLIKKYLPWNLFKEVIATNDE